MTQYHFDVIAQALRPHVGGSWFTAATDDVLTALKESGYIIVDKGAIGRAQREAVVVYCEDNGWRPKRTA